MNLFKVTRALPGDSVSGKITFAAKRGQIVQIDPTSVAAKGNVFTPDTAWKLATGTRGFHLERDVIVGPIDLATIAFDKDFLHPDVVNPDTNIGYASARKVQEFEVEGADLIDSSIDGNTPVNTPVSVNLGKLSLVAKAADKVFADGVTTNTSTTMTSATAAFKANDVGKTITGAGIPAGTTIASRTNATTIVLSQAATATATGVSFTIVDREGVPTEDVPGAETYGWIRGQLGSQDPDGVNLFRLLVEVAY